MSNLRRILGVPLVSIGLLFSAIQCEGYAANYYVDYAGGSDSNSGTNAAAPWKHCPGDPKATGNAVTNMPAGSTVYFKGGQSYVLLASNPTPYTAGIAVQNGSSGNPITYDGQTWTGTKANITDNYSSNSVIAFATLSGGMQNVVIKGFDIGPIGGANPLPPDTGTELTAKPGWGVWSEAGPASNVQIINCDFHELGYWQNTKPIGPDSFTAANAPSPAGVQADGWVNCVISNCTFTKVHTGIELSYIYHPISNLTVANCNIHDYMVWGIDLASSPSSACADYIYIHDNQIHDIGWYYGAGWSGYTDSGGSDQHQDPIFHRIGAGGNVAGCNGTNIDIYNNTFYDSEHYDSVATAYVSLEGGVSANIYNNLFNLPNFNLFIYRNIDDIQASNSLVRVLNNTFIQNTTNANNLVAMSWESQGLNNVWSSLHKVQVLNNVFYDFATNGASSLDSSYFYAWNDTNTATCESAWTIDHNLYRSYDTGGFATWWEGSFGSVEGGLPWMRANGWDANSVAVDPKFSSLAYASTINAYLNDYHLQSSSPAIGAGVNLSSLNLPGLNADRDGTPRPASGPWDIGAYEYNTNSVSPSPPAASFSATPTSGAGPLTVTFTDASTGSITGRSWQFGDGKATNTTATSVVYQYTAAGTDTVQLVVSGPGGSSTNVQANLIMVTNTNSLPLPAPVASFSATPTSGAGPLTVTFTDASTGSITGRSWQFGDGKATNTTATSVVYQYTAAGTDTVQLVVSGPGGSSTNVQANLIAVGSTNSVPLPPPVASFSATPTSGTAPLTVTFTDTSTGSIASRSWQFGDGNVTNTTATSVVYQYTTAGTDTVQLVVSGPGGSSTNVQANLIIVGNSTPAPIASFSAAPTSGTVPLTVTFTDTSTGNITSRSWQFGDGTTANASGTTITHQYTGAGTNTIQLVVSGPGGSSTNVQANLITVSVPAPVAVFSATPTNGTAPLTVTFTDLSFGSITNRFWFFGDKASTNTLATTMTHRYTTAGTNSVSLRVYGPGGINIDIQSKLVVVSAVGGNTNSAPAPVASFGATPTSGTVPLTVTFTDTSTGTITNRFWQFGDGNVMNTIASTLNYQYTGAGTDTVRLIVSGPGGSSTNVQSNLITVANTNSVPAPVAAFSATPTSGTAPLTVTFTDTSTGSITNRAWQFGDGTSATTSGITMTHQYAAAGTNTVQLVVSGPGGASVGVQGNLIIVNSSSAPSPSTNGVVQVRGHYHWRFLAAH